MKKTILMAIMLLLLFTAMGCGSNNQPRAGENGNNANNAGDTNAGNADNTQQTGGELTIGTEGTYAPFTFHDKDGKLTGYDVEVAEEVCERIGMTPRFIEAKWDGMIAGLDAKRYDMVANEVAVREERLEKYDMSDPYIISRAVLIVREDNEEIKSLDDLKGKKVGQSLDSNYRKIAEEHGATNTVIEGFNQAIDLLVSKRIDATINDSLSYLDLKKQRPELPLKTVYEEPNATSNAFLFRKGSDELVGRINQAIKDMRADGTLLSISQTWFNTDVTQ